MKLCPLSEFTTQMIATLEYEQHLKAEEKRGEVESRMDNLRELIGNIKEIERDVPQGEDALRVFLENVALVSDIDTLQEGNGAVALMTLHSAKGLEFPIVFMVGMEENIFPTSRARQALSQSAMEEERRLCYVGMTRARQKLYLVNASMRTLYGSESFNHPSRFLSEVPEALIACENAKKGESAELRPTRARKPEAKVWAGTRETAPTPHRVQAKDFSPYQKVRHEMFGEGTVMDVSGSGASMLITIDFGGAGVKKFAAAYAPINVVK